jgi:aminopeptidase N
VLLHEMAHMWFGNIVTMRWWDDLWLNEAFAEFAANWALTRATRFTDAWARHLADDKQQAYLADQGPGSHPIRQAVPDVAAAAATFDAITYPKGASVLQQLMTYLGEETFIRGMAAYFARHAWGNTTLQDLMDGLATASGRDLDHWRDTWLEEAGPDVLMLEQSGATFELLATPAPGTRAPRPHVVGIGAYRRTSSGLSRVAFETVEVTAERTPVELPEGADLYLANDDDLTFARCRPDAASQAALFALAAELPTPTSRGVAVSTVRDLLVSGEARAAEVVECLVRVLHAETAPTCVEPYLALVTRVAEYWSPEAERAGLSQQVAQTCAEFVEQGRYQQAARRAWARTGSLEDLEQLDEASTADIDLRWRVLMRRAELGDVAGDDVLDRLVEKDRDPEAWVRALTVRTAVADTAAKAAAWEALAEHRKVPISSVGQVANAFWRPGQDELLAPYAERYLEAVPTLDHGGMIQAMGYARALFPVFAIDADYLDRVVALSQDTAPIVRARVEERADEVRRMLVTRGL